MLCQSWHLLQWLMAAGSRGTCLTHQQKASQGGLIILVCICLLSHLLAGWN